MRSLLILVAASLVACSQPQHLAPVSELTWQPFNPHSGKHIVRRGETLYAIAFRYDRDFRQLAINNHLSSPYNLRIGQVISLQSHPQAAKHPIARPHPSYSHTRQAPSGVKRLKNSAAGGSSGWIWPVRGRIVSGFSPLNGKKGIDIAGRKGEAVHAAASGIVAYSGNGLNGYGNLIIIKHDGLILTAYGNNFKNRVKEGQRVKAGQIIADIGIVNRQFWGLHFEIRRAGQPVNPLTYLQRQ